MLDILELVNDATCWDDIYYKLIKKNIQNDRSAGRLFEIFCKYYYLCEPSIKNEYQDIWLFSEIPHDIKQLLNLAKNDHGVDLVLKSQDGSYFVVQCKFKNDQSKKISWTQDNLANLFAEGDKADYFIVFTNASGLDSHSLKKQQDKLKLVTYGDLLSISSSTIQAIKKKVVGEKDKAIHIKKPRTYQKIAIQEVVAGFKKYDRGQLILPCGTGKTLISLWITQALKAKHTLILVPSLALLRQIKKEWYENINIFMPYICVCSEQDVNVYKNSNDHVSIHTYDIPGKVTTDPTVISSFLEKNDRSFVFSTYQSLKSICDATRNKNFEFDLAICDEAHKTTGSKLSRFSLVHFNDNIPIKRRLYMTATPRIMSDKLKQSSGSEVAEYFCDMSDIKIFGYEFHRMAFKDAIELGILVDYKVIAIGINDVELKEAILSRRYVSDKESIDEIASNIALDKFMTNNNFATHAITFHSSVKKANYFNERHKIVNPKVNGYHVNGNQTTNDRTVIMNNFKNASKAIITNARCLTEGIDVPEIDIIYFCDPKNSKIDIVQAVGRVLRRSSIKDKKLGYVVVPIFHLATDEIEKIIDSSPFKNLMGIIRALCSHDERLVDEIKRIKVGRGKIPLQNFNLSLIDSSEIITVHGFHEKLRENLFEQVVDKTRFPWRDFIEARPFVHTLNLKNRNDWVDFCKSIKKPDDIPTDAAKVYKSSGWTTWGDWLGTNYILPKNRKYRLFESARLFVHTLNLKSIRDWNNFCKNGKKPNDIPSNARAVYKNNGWVSWGDWLGTGYITPKNRVYRTFEEAREFIHTQDLRGKDAWVNYCKSKGKPDDIPGNPSSFYKDTGWVSWGDWLGTGYIASQNRAYRAFEEAREFMHTLGLQSKDDWAKFCKRKEKPNDIPGNPSSFYKDTGWISWGDWLGTGYIAPQNRIYQPFEEAKKFVHSLNLKSISDWKHFCKNAGKPDDIPSSPDHVYKEAGWISWGDWFGTNYIATYKLVYRPFEEARKFIRSLNLKTQKEWVKYCESGNKPDDIPAAVQRVYKDLGWMSMGDWLGTDYIASQNRVYKSFEEAKKFVHQLNLKTRKDWVEYCRSGNKPDDIPIDLPGPYKDKGWISWGDWLGTDYIAPQNRIHRSFEKSREFVHKLGLKSWKEWRDYAKSDEKPTDIPSYPNETYENKGWISVGDWLGTEVVASQNKIYKSFEEAREFVHMLNLKSYKDWIEYCKSGNKPDDLPTDIRQVYKNKGWISMGDWLGTGAVAPYNRIFRPFYEARKFARSLKLKNKSGWAIYCKNGEKPDDIPSDLPGRYKNNGWISWSDWLGTKTNEDVAVE